MSSVVFVRRMCAAVTLSFCLQMSGGAQCDLKELARLDSGDASVSAFGGSVGMDGGRALVGFQPDQDVGKAYLFEGEGVSWSLAQTLTPSDGGQGFGGAVAISGDVAVVGAALDDVTFTNSGSAYVFERQAGSWSEVAKLTAPDAAANVRFGSAVDIDGDRIIIGAPYDSTVVTNGGSAYLFERQGSAWVSVRKLFAADASTNARFGFAVAVNEEAVVVGVDSRDSAYILEKLGSIWWQTAKLSVPDGEIGTEYGHAVDIRADLAIVGASNHTTSGGERGLAYVYQKQGAFWVLASTLDVPGGNGFGASVSLSERRAVVGAPGANVGSNTVGAAYVFEEAVPGWTLTEVIHASDRENSDQFGTAVALSGQNAIITSPGDDNSLGTNRGSAYITQTYRTDSFDEYGTGCAGSGNFTPSLTVTGCGAPGDTITFALTDGFGGALALFFLGTARGSLVLGSGCEFLTDPVAGALFSVPLFGTGPGSGQAVFMAGVPLSPAVPSFTIQSFVLDAGVPRGFSSTNGVEVFLHY